MTNHDAVVIGAGAGGGIVAKELATAGLNVLLLERGKAVTPADCRKDDLANQRTSALGAPFGPDERRNPRVAVDAKGNARVITVRDGGYNNNAACVGGGTQSYGAMAWRFLPKDFRMKETYGVPAGSTLEDWPIRYEDLEPFYEKAEYELGVSGDMSADPFHGPRRKPLPMPPLPPTREHEILEAATKRMGLHPFPIPMLRNSVPYGGRPPCMRCRWCVGFACEVDAKAGTQNTVIPIALSTGNCRLETQAIVSEITTGADGRPDGVTYFDARDRRQQAKASVIVVSGGAVESARLLLNSKSRLFPQGLGNHSDWVGRNLQGHAYSGATGVFPVDTFDDLGPGASVAVCDYNHGNPGLAGGALLCNEFIRLPVQAYNDVPPGVRSWGRQHKQFLQQNYRRTMGFRGPTQEIPVFDARVQVDSSVKDHWGIPVARLSGGKHPHTLEIAAAMASKAEAVLKEAGATQTWLNKAGPGLSGGQHQAGTCRMGDDPQTSAVNRYCQVHGAENVFVVDGSVHVTNGGFNPVLTIMAIAYWASDFVKREWKGTRFRGA
ncbi:MAG: GMC family oxidoreductase [Bryobacterales bacterium]|jgi:choline dehydrogenase-like flavoprotein|nr:GMC family oxidoreductase [Bryobacterales bacterium]